LAFAEPNLKLSDAQPFFASKFQILIWTSVIFLIAANYMKWLTGGFALKFSGNHREDISVTRLGKIREAEDAPGAGIAPRS
jgi:hypothetical protein